MKYYAAYGSNLNKEQMARRCPEAVPVCTAFLRNYELAFRRGYLTVDKKEGGSVPIGIWLISERDEASLDRYEGYPKFYTKEEVVLEGSDGKKRMCMIYIMVPGHKPQPPTDGYFTIVYHGYREFGLEFIPLVNAYERAKWPED